MFHSIYNGNFHTLTWVLPPSELLATKSVTKNYEVQKCLKLKLYSIRSLNFFLSDSKFFETFLNQLGASSYRYSTEKFWEIERERITYENGVLVFIVCVPFRLTD